MNKKVKLKTDREERKRDAAYSRFPGNRCAPPVRKRAALTPVYMLRPAVFLHVLHMDIPLARTMEGEGGTACAKRAM